MLLLLIMHILNVSLETLCEYLQWLLFILPLFPLEYPLNDVFFEVVMSFLCTQDSWLDYVIIGKFGSRYFPVAVEVAFFVLYEKFKLL